jgi:O-antigen/teichoic acid export membrane protein
MIKYFKLDQRQRKKLFSLVMASFLLIIPAMMLLSPLSFFGQNYLFNKFSVVDFFVVSAAIFSAVYFNFFSALLRNQLRAFYFVSYNIGNALAVGTTTLFCIIYLKLTYLSFLYGLLIGNGICILIGVVEYRKYFTTIKIKEGKSILFDLLKISWPIIPSQINCFVLASGDRYLLKMLSGEFAVGVYSVGYRFANIVQSFLIVPFFGSYNPIAFDLFVKDTSAFKDSQKKYLIILVLLVTVSAILVSIPFERLFKYFIDRRYWSGYRIIGWISLAYLFQGIYFLFDIVQTMFEKLHYGMCLGFVTAILSIVLNVFLIPAIGIEGSAITLCICYFCAMLGSLFINNSLLTIDYDLVRVIKIIIIGCITIFLQHNFGATNIIWDLSLRGLWALVGLCALYLLNFRLINNLLRQTISHRFELVELR